MSSTYRLPFTVDAQAQSSREYTGDLDLDKTHLPNTSYEQSHLSPYSSQTISNNTSPYNIGSTPGESISEYSNYQPSDYSEIEDPFCGVDFDAELLRTGSFPAAIFGNAAYQSVPVDPDEQDLEKQIEPIPKSTSDSLTTAAFPLKPGHTSPKREAIDLKTKITITQHELSAVPNQPTALRLTSDYSGSSHTSTEVVEIRPMARSEQSPHFMGSQWGKELAQTKPHTLIQHTGQYESATNLETDDRALLGHLHAQNTQGSAPQDVAGARRAGLAPESWTKAEVPSVKQQEEQRRINIRNEEVQEWRSQAGGSSEDEQASQSNFDLTQARPTRPRDPDEESNDIPQVDDAASIHVNRLQDGQIYYNLKTVRKSETDEQIMSLPRQWNDGPSLPHMTTTQFQQPATSNEAIQRWNVSADTISITSRAATWGTERRRASEPSLMDYGDFDNGSFLKKLSIKPREGERRQSNIFDQGLDRIANMVRKKSDAKLKRARSSQNIPQETQNVPHPRNNSQGTLAPPSRISSFGRNKTPSINTAIGAMTGSIGAVGNPHTRKGSINGAPTSPKSPPHLGFTQSARDVINRVRSRSELTAHDRTAQLGLVNLWKGHGGPPALNLATSPPLETEVTPQQQPKPKSKYESKPQAPSEIVDQDDDEDEDDEPGDDGDVKIEPEQQSDPIVPNYEGFKAHVRRVNPDMDPRYKWLVSRIAHQQEIRYKTLLDLRVKHSQAVSNRSCSAARHCMAFGGIATLLDANGNPRDSEHNNSALHLQTDFSDDSNPGDGALTHESFPQGVPMPPSRNLPAEFECQLCFKVKKFQKPSDWTKHVHEDVQPFTCTYEKCKEPKSFKRKADWVRHENERHRHLEWWVCEVEDCTHPCYRKDNFLQHLVREHKLPEPKQKTKASIKKARDTEPVWNMLEQCRHETKNKPQDEPCKFCGKSFNTWKKLTVHLAKHMELISLPVSRLVASRIVDANTIISPVEQILTPVTPTGRAKMESASPFNMNNVSPHIPRDQPYSSGFDQARFYSPAQPYDILMPDPQEVTYDQRPPFFCGFETNPQEQPQGFVPMNNNGLGNMSQGRPYGSIDSEFTQAKIEQHRPFASVDSSFSSTMPEHNYNLHTTSGFPMSQLFSTVPPVTSGYQTTNTLGISQPGFDFNAMAINDERSFQQPPLRRAQGNASSYGHPTANMPNFYSQQP